MRGTNRLPGFHAVSGSAFHAFIHPCDAPGNSFKSIPDGGHQMEEWKDPSSFSGSGISIFPNPNQGVFSVRTTRSMSALVGIEVFDAMGREVKVRVDNNSSGSEVNVPSALNTGLYVVRALHADGTRSQATIILQP